MNTRAALHTLAVVLTAIATGTVVLAGLSEETTKIIVSIAGLSSLAINTWMSTTTTGHSR